MIVMYGKGKVGESVINLSKHIGIEVVLMDDSDTNNQILTNAEYIVVTPGIVESHPIYKFSDKILSELDFLYMYKDRFPFWGNSTFIGITGTNGKSTTSWVLYNILSHYLSSDSSFLCWLGGNFSTPLSSLFLKILEEGSETKRHIFVVETSSFMLAHTRHFTYMYGVLLNIARDHLDWHGTMEKYVLAKENILALSDKSFVSMSVLSLLSKSYAHATVFDEYLDIQHTHFLGHHNQQNLGAVSAVCNSFSKDFQLPAIDVPVLLQDIYPLPHRLSPIKKIGDIIIIDDAICTSAAACKAALEAMPEQCVLIAGGYDKGDDYSILSPWLSEKVSHIVLLGQTSDRIATIARDIGVSFSRVTSLQEAIRSALAIAQKERKNYVLFSPAAASFDMFKNVYDRIDQFEKIIETL